MNVLGWEDVEGAAEQAFSIWVDQPELAWASEAWGILTKAGLTRHANDVERCEAALRFLALAGLYHDFCDAAFEETSYPDYATWASSLGITNFRLGQLVGRSPRWSRSLDDPEDDSELLGEVLLALVEAQRESVLQALVAGYGSISGLFIALWRSRRPPRPAAPTLAQRTPLDEPADEDDDDEEDLDGDEEETDDDIVNSVDEDKMVAFEWLTDGAPPRTNW